MNINEYKLAELFEKIEKNYMNKKITILKLI